MTKFRPTAPTTPSTVTPGIVMPCLPAAPAVPMLEGMFIVTDADAAAIRAAFDEGGELSAAVELRRRFQGVEDMAEARTWARAIAGWTPITLPDPPP